MVILKKSYIHPNKPVNISINEMNLIYFRNPVELTQAKLSQDSVFKTALTFGNSILSIQYILPPNSIHIMRYTLIKNITCTVCDLCSQ